MNIKMILLIEKRFLFISSDLLPFKVTPAKSQCQIYFEKSHRVDGRGPGMPVKREKTLEFSKCEF